MSPHGLQLTLSLVEVCLGTIVLVLLIRARELGTYWPMLLVSMWQVLPLCALLYLRRFGRGRMSAMHAYNVYYSIYWSMFALGAIAAIVLTYTILHGAMRPLKGLQQLGKIVYFWAAGISLFVGIDNATFTYEGMDALQNTMIHFQHATGIITVSLVLFVCLAIRPMGLTVRSRIFGTGVGLAIISVMTTLEANAMRPHQIFSPYTLAKIVINCLVEALWIYYFALPEPKRKFVLLSTTSPFHHWNRIAEQFGAQPGYVAIGGIPPDALAGAEMEVFRRASVKMKETAEDEAQTPQRELPLVNNSLESNT